MLRIDIKGCIVSDDVAWIYDFFGMQYCCPKHVNDTISSAGGERLDIYINSGGGDIFAGSEIYSAIRSYSGDVNIHVVGIAASAASVIACAAQSDISPTAMMMVHNVSSCAEGDYHDMDKESEVLKKANETIANAYVMKSGMQMQDALAMMDKETWLSAHDAVSKGLIDKVSESQNLQLVASIGSGMLPKAVIDKMKNQRQEGKLYEAISYRKTQAKLNLLKIKGGVL